MPPADLVRAACRRWGERDVIERCAALLAGADPHADPELVEHLGGAHGRAYLTRGDHDYWPRTWAARAMLYAWDDRAQAAVVRGLGDSAWRVREMSAKVAMVREVGAAADALGALLTDPVPRVRAAAARALAVVGEAEHADGLRGLLSDPDPEVRRRADQSLRRLARRLDRDL